MKNLTIREKVINEIDKIPEDKLTSILDLIHHFRIGIQQSQRFDADVQHFSGCWKDMPDRVYESFRIDVQKRRRSTFTRRRDRETDLG